MYLVYDVKLSYGGKFIELKALVDTGASKSVISKRFAEMLNAFIPLKEPYELRTADEEGRLKIIGRCMVNVEFQGVKCLVVWFLRLLKILERVWNSL